MANKIFSKHIVEIRYKPNSRFLDKRGETAELLASSLVPLKVGASKGYNYSTKTNFVGIDCFARANARARRLICIGIWGQKRIGDFERRKEKFS